MEVLATTRIVIWEGASLWLVDVLPSRTADRRSTDLHAHHAIQITIPLGGVSKLAESDGPWRTGSMAVAPDASHKFDAEGLVAHLFIEPESRAGRAIAASLFGEGAVLAPIPSEALADFPQRAQALPAHVGDEALIDLTQDLISRLAGGARGDMPDYRVRKMIALAAARIDGPVSLADVAEGSDLSASRLSHLFVEQTGLPFRTYLLWLRLSRSIKRLADGAGLTEAAHESGFSDSAHFSRTFRRMFGVSPTNLRMT